MRTVPALAARQISEHAWKCVGSVPDRALEEYRNAVRGAASVVLAGGLGPACALFAGKKGAPRTLYRHLEEWLLEHVYPDVIEDEGHLRLVRRMVASDTARYRRAKREALALLGWLKLFVEARLQAAAGSAGTDAAT